MPELDLETIRVDRQDGVVTVTLDRPARKNPATTQMWIELRRVFEAVGSGPADRVLILTGAGDAFCSGADLGGGEGDDAPDTHHLARMRLIGDTCVALHRLPKPTITRVNGIAAGAGLNMALACDLIVASTSARFSEIFARRGLSVDFGGSWVLPRLIGLHRAKELVLLADIIDAAEAERIGLVNRVVEPEALDTTVHDWARRLAEGPPIALGLSKRLLNDAMARTLEEAVEDEGRAQSINFVTADTAEAILAFMQKRTPTFRGR